MLFETLGDRYIRQGTIDPVLLHATQADEHMAKIAAGRIVL
jgi:hypothetical protein